MVSHEWVLPSLPVYGELGKRVVSTDELAKLIRKNLLKHNYPVGQPGGQVLRADAYPAIKRLFVQHRIPQPTPEEEIAFPAALVSELQRRVDAMPKAVPEIDPDAPTTVDLTPGKSTTAFPDEKTEEELEFPSEVATMSQEPADRTLPDRSATPENGHPRAPIGLDDPEEFALVKEWHLPQLPEFQGRAKHPQSLMNLQKLIQRGTLKPYHHIRQGAPGDGYEGYAGTFPELIPLFKELDPEFDPSTVAEKAQAAAAFAPIPLPMPGEAPKARRNSSSGGLKDFFGKFTASEENRGSEHYGTRDFAPENNQFVMASKVGWTSGLLIFALAWVFYAVEGSFMEKFGGGFFGHLVGTGILFALIQASTLLTAHVIGLINGQNRGNQWNFGMCYVISLAIWITWDMIYIQLLPEMPFDFLNFFRPGLISITILNLIECAVFAFVMQQFGNWYSENIGGDTYYRFPREFSREGGMAVGFIAALAISVGYLSFDLDVQYQQMRSRKNMLGMSDEIKVEDLFWNATLEGDWRLRVTGTVVNQVNAEQENWSVRIRVFDEEDRPIARGIIRDKVFAFKLPGNKDPAEEAPGTGTGAPSPGPLEPGEHWRFEVVFTDLEAFPARAEATVGSTLLQGLSDLASELE